MGLLQLCFSRTFTFISQFCHMKVFIAQQNYHIGNFGYNQAKMLEAIAVAKSKGADLVVFSELSVCGYPPRDFLEFSDFISQCENTVAEIAQYTDDIGVIVGSPVRNPQQQGKDLLNAALFLYQGKIYGEVHKTLLPNYDVFDEYRYFEPASEWKIINFKGNRIALTICEDIWNLGDNPLYTICPMDKLEAQKPDLMINISASPFDYDHDQDRLEVVRRNVLKYQLPMIYCNAVGAQTEILFDGGSMACTIKGEVVHTLAFFKEDYCMVDVASLHRDSSGGETYHQMQMGTDMRVTKANTPDSIIQYLTAAPNIAQIREALVMGISDYFAKMGFKKAILGSSGGIDSAVVLALAVEALGKENVTAVLMPSGFSSTHSVDDAIALSKNLGNPYHIVPIQPVYEELLQTLSPLFEGTNFGLAEENIQSRSRGNILMAIANKFGHVLLNTSNKSELATGYGTLYGDMAGGLSVIGDLYKTQVYALAQHLNAHGELIPHHILTKAPSAELRPNQKDSDSLPEYDELDRILYQYIERRMGPGAIISNGADPALVNRVLKMVNNNEYKRNQFCPIIRVSTKAFGVGRRVPIVAKYLS
jgi:NAD+ synthase (glutamine-hydrolysing)